MSGSIHCWRTPSAATYCAVKRIARLLLGSVLVGCSSEDPAFLAWAERAADAQCACAAAENPGECVLDIDPDLAFTDKNVEEKARQWRGKGSERTSAALRRAGECDEKVRAWEDAHANARTAGGTKPSARPPTQPAASTELVEASKPSDAKSAARGAAGPARGQAPRSLATSPTAAKRPAAPNPPRASDSPF